MTNNLSFDPDIKVCRCHNKTSRVEMHTFPPSHFEQIFSKHSSSIPTECSKAIAPSFSRLLLQSLISRVHKICILEPCFMVSALYLSLFRTSGSNKWEFSHALVGKKLQSREWEIEERALCFERETKPWRLSLSRILRPIVGGAALCFKPKMR